MSRGRNSVADCILDYIKVSLTDVFLTDLVKAVSQNSGVSAKDVRTVIKKLVNEGELEYRTYKGYTSIHLSFSRPVRLSENVIVSPPELTVDHNNDDIVVYLNKGTAFGNGDHPTTRLCVKLLDYLFTGYVDTSKKNISSLDVGTGSGILAIVSALSGVKNVIASDRDPVAESEANGNFILNNCGDKIKLVQNIALNRTFDIITANLRYPTLIDLFPVFEKLTGINSFLVLSGIKESEKKIVDDRYIKNGLFRCQRADSYKNWVGLVYQKVK